MYAVVFKGRVIVGPMEWNRGIFEGSLRKEGVDAVLPRRAPEELPLIIDDNTTICLVQESRPAINRLTHYHYGPLWSVENGVAIASYDIVPNPIESVRVNYKQLAAEERWKKEVSGIRLVLNGIEVSLDTTREARNIFTQQYTIMKDSDTINWKFGIAWINLTKSDIQTIIAAIQKHVQDSFDWEAGISTSIDAASTVDEILSIQIKEEALTNI